jgi:hypothetical protein
MLVLAKMLANRVSVTVIYRLAPLHRVISFQTDVDSKDIDRQVMRQLRVLYSWKRVYIKGRTNFIKYGNYLLEPSFGFYGSCFRCDLYRRYGCTVPWVHHRHLRVCYRVSCISRRPTVVICA